MFKVRLSVLAIAVSLKLCSGVASTITEDFSTNPFQHGWKTFGDTNLFRWDSTSQDLAVTWDSAQPNSYFYHLLGTVLTRDDDFSTAFDLRLADIGAGPDTNKASSFAISIGFLNLDLATETNFLRGTGTNSPDLAEFAYFWDSGFGATTWPTFADTNSTFNYNSSSDYAIFALAPGDWYHIILTYTASNQTAITTVTNFEKTSGVRLTQLINTNFADYRLGSFSVSSYSDAGQDPTQYPGSVLAHGAVDNLVVTVPDPPLTNVVGLISNGAWRAQFSGRTNWLYTLQRTEDSQTWTDVSAPIPGQTSSLTLTDTNPVPAHSLYRIRANRP